MACRLLREPDLRPRPKRWLEKLVGIINRPGQHLSDINRRSAGIPFAFVAIFLAEPQGGHRVSAPLHKQEEAISNKYKLPAAKISASRTAATRQQKYDGKFRDQIACHIPCGTKALLRWHGVESIVRNSLASSKMVSLELM